MTTNKVHKQIRISKPIKGANGGEKNPNNIVYKGKYSNLLNFIRESGLLLLDIYIRTTTFYNIVPKKGAMVATVLFFEPSRGPQVPRHPLRHGLARRQHLTCAARSKTQPRLRPRRGQRLRVEDDEPPAGRRSRTASISRPSSTGAAPSPGAGRTGTGTFLAPPPYAQAPPAPPMRPKHSPALPAPAYNVKRHLRLYLRPHGLVTACLSGVYSRGMRAPTSFNNGGRQVEQGRELGHAIRWLCRVHSRTQRRPSWLLDTLPPAVRFGPRRRRLPAAPAEGPREDVGPGEYEWIPETSHLVLLDSGKVFVAKFFQVRKNKFFPGGCLYGTGESFAVFTGVEPENSGGQLRMWKHKSMRYTLNRHLQHWII